MNDLFGQLVVEKSLPAAAGETKRRPTPPKGYAAPPGTGPTGETCGTCRHIAHTGNAGKYKKCLLQRHRWTGGPGSDIRSKSAACSRWQLKEAKP